MLPYRQLSYAVAVADHGGVQAASEKIAISQPALSNAVQKVEQEYGLKIFIRDRPNKLALTSVGRRFIAQAKRLIENAEEFEDLAKNLSKNSSGTIQLGCFTPTAAFIIPIILQALETRGLDISLQIHEADLDEFETLIEEKPYVMIARNDPLASKKSIALKELVEKDMVSLNLPLTQQYFLSCFSQHNLRPKVRHQTKSYELVRSLVGAGEGYAIMIMRPVTNRAYNGTGLAYIPLADDVPPAQYGLAITNRAIPTKLIERFSEICRDTLLHEKAADHYFVRR